MVLRYSSEFASVTGKHAHSQIQNSLPLFFLHVQYSLHWLSVGNYEMEYMYEVYLK